MIFLLPHSISRTPVGTNHLKINSVHSQVPLFSKNRLSHWYMYNVYDNLYKGDCTKKVGSSCSQLACKCRCFPAVHSPNYVCVRRPVVSVLTGKSPKAQQGLFVPSCGYLSYCLIAQPSIFIVQHEFVYKYCIYFKSWSALHRMVLF